MVEHLVLVIITYNVLRLETHHVLLLVLLELHQNAIKQDYQELLRYNMGQRIYFVRVDFVLLNKLYDEIAAITNIEGVADEVMSQQRVGVDFLSEPDSILQDQVQSIITAHDPTDFVVQLRQADYNNLVNEAANIIQQLNAGINANLNDQTALVSATTFAIAKPIVANMLNREAKMARAKACEKELQQLIAKYHCTLTVIMIEIFPNNTFRFAVNINPLED